MTYGESLTAGVAKWQRSRGCLLTFHRTAIEEKWKSLPNRNFYLVTEFLDALLGFLTGNGWRIVTISELIANLRSEGDGSRLVNFSVDDGYRDTFETVVPLFKKHGVPVTVMVTTGIPDRTLTLSRAGLESIIANKRIIRCKEGVADVFTQEAKHRLYRRLAGDWEQQGDFDREYRHFCTLNGAGPAELDSEHAITWEMLESLRDDPLVEIGAHTVSHPRISALSEPEARSELYGCRSRLQTRLGIDCDHFAFPYGRSGDCGEREFALANEVGFTSAATTRKGLLLPGQDAFSIPRNTINGAFQSITYVNALLSGMAGFGARVLRRV